jgi:hypothetical protein
LVTLANKIIDAISKSLASGGSLKQIPRIVKDIKSSQSNSDGNPPSESKPNCFPDCNGRLEAARILFYL